MGMRRWCVLIFLFLASFGVNAQLLMKDEPAFKEGEVATYNVYYNLGFVWIHAGDVVFSVKANTEKGANYYLLQVAGYTIKSFDNLYCIF